ncbi:MAG: nicotinate-nucleotide diphosphorylase (carboxylating), partial [Candidatus Methylomirabilota bacterium]
ALRTIMSRHLGLTRDGDGLRLAAEALRGLEQQLQAASTAPAMSWAAADKALRVGNALLAARMIAESALRRTESRGAHQRRDHPAQDDLRWLRHIACRLDDAGELILDELPVRLTP